MQINLLNEEDSEQRSLEESEIPKPEPETTNDEEPEFGFSDPIKDMELETDLEPKVEMEAPVREEPEYEEETEEEELDTAPFSVFDSEESVPLKKKSWIFILLFFFMVMAGGAAYWFLFRPAAQQKSPASPVDYVGVDSSTTIDEPVGEDVPVEEATSPLQPFEKEVLASVQSGVSSIVGVCQAAPDRAAISMLTYHGDQSLTMRSVATTTDELNTYYQSLQERFPNVQIEKSGIDNRVVGGRSVRRMTFSLSNLETIEPTGTGKVQILDIPQLKERMEQLAVDAGVNIQSISGGVRSFPGAGIVRTPLSFKITGSHDASLKFLEGLAAARLNLRFSKVMLLSSDSNVSRLGSIDLILHVELIRPA